MKNHTNFNCSFAIVQLQGAENKFKKCSTTKTIMLKNKLLLSIFIILIIIKSSIAQTNMERPWFTNKNCTSLEIKKFKSISNHEIQKSVKINDLKIIQELMARINKINPNGKEMISFTENAEHIDVLFYCENQPQIIQIYQGKFKTPSTGFNFGENEIEMDLYHDIGALLFPDHNKKILKIENLELLFKDFSITYLGSEFHDYAPATIQITKNKFLIKDKNNIEQLIEIPSGQLPPQPFEVDVNNSKLFILIYQSLNSEQLYPYYFQIIK